MSALREWAATLGPSARAAVAVNAWGKWKTASQVRQTFSMLWVPVAVAAAVWLLLHIARPWHLLVHTTIIADLACIISIPDDSMRDIKLLCAAELCHDST